MPPTRALPFAVAFSFSLLVSATIARANHGADAAPKKEHALATMMPPAATRPVDFASDIKPLLEAMDADSTRFDGVEILGVDEHVWHHVNPLKRGPKALTGMVNPTRAANGKTPEAAPAVGAGRSGGVCRAATAGRGEGCRPGG